MIAVVLVNYHGFDDTCECLESLVSARDERVRVVVVDNDSGENEAHRLAERYPWITVIASRENTGWSGGNNLGIEEALHPRDPNTAAADAVFLLNNDTIVDASVIQEIRRGMEQGWDIVGPVINEFDDRDKIQTEGALFNRRDRVGFFSSIAPNSTAIIDTDIVNGCAVAIHRRVFEKIGRIDDRFFLICEESDFCLRAQRAGFRLGIIPRSLVWHKHSVSFQRAGKPLQRYYGIRNLWLLLCKHWGGSGRRGLTASFLAYFRYVYHVHCHELELGNPSGANAVMIGLADGILGRFGPSQIKMNLLSRCLSALFRSIWKIRGGRLAGSALIEPNQVEKQIHDDVR